MSDDAACISGRARSVSEARDPRKVAGDEVMVVNQLSAIMDVNARVASLHQCHAELHDRMNFLFQLVNDMSEFIKTLSCGGACCSTSPPCK